jgi:hypothetical protein
MNTILATYDLRGRDETSQDYARLIAELKAYKNVINPLYSVWVIQSDWTAKQVRDDLVRWIDDDDRLLVIDVTGGDVAWRRLRSADADWLRNSP